MPLIVDGTSGVTFNDSSLQGAAASPFGLKNRIINGAMQVWQRGTSFSASGANFYTADRWQTLTQTGTYSRSTDVPAGFQYSLSINSTSTFFGTITQRIESANAVDLAGQTVTISFWAKATVGGASGLAVGLDYANSVDNFSSNTFIGGGSTAALTSTWTRYSVTVTNLNANVVNGLQVYIYNQAGGTSAITYLITGVQLEIGTSATPFERRLYNQELANCQRYYYKLQSNSADSFFGSAFNVSTTLAIGITFFPVTLRTAPSALEQSGTAGDYRVRASAGNTNCSAVPTWDGSSVNNGTTIFTVASGLTSGQGVALRAVNSSAYLAWSAEL